MQDVDGGPSSKSRVIAAPGFYTANVPREWWPYRMVCDDPKGLQFIDFEDGKFANGLLIEKVWPDELLTYCAGKARIEVEPGSKSAFNLGRAKFKFTSSYFKCADFGLDGTGGAMLSLWSRLGQVLTIAYSCLLT